MRKFKYMALLAGLCLGASTARAQEEASAGDSGWPGAGANLMASRTLGVGFGTNVSSGQSIFEPNTASVRFTATDMIVLEPFINLGYASMSTDPEGPGATTSTSSTTLGVGTQARYFLRSADRLQLDFLGGLSFLHTGGENTSRQVLGLNWGLGLSWFFARNWGLSLDATNPLFSYTRMHTENVATVSTLDFGLRWNPTVLAMIHLYM